jgi:hypothetical protein
MRAISIRINLKTVAASVPMHQRRKGVKGRRNQFYERLEKTYKQCPSYDVKIILNDTNAKVVKEMWTGTAAGTCGLHDESNDNGTRILNYAVHQIMFIGEHYWEDIIRMDLQEVGFGGID